jgi:hypothetical protein
MFSSLFLARPVCAKQQQPFHILNDMPILFIFVFYICELTSQVFFSLVTGDKHNPAVRANIEKKLFAVWQACKLDFARQLSFK